MMGRKPAYCTVSLTGTHTISGYVPNNGASVTKLVNKRQPLLSGNRIGHFPECPKQFIAPSHHKRPPTISEVIKGFTASYFETKMHKYLNYHVDEFDQPTRKIRSEFREMISMGCSIITHYYDVMTGELGFHNDIGKFIRLSYEQLAIKLNVSLIRVKRFFAFLKARELVRILEDREIDSKGNWISNTSRKLILPSFFIKTLGAQAWKQIQQLKEWRIKKEKPKTKKQAENVALLKGMITMPIRKITKSKAFVKRIDPYREQQFVKDAMYAYERDPSKPPSEHLRILKAQSQF